ncbi:unnamed protein product [Caenorhabditis angaria]|uniref:thioredoxin-dependent peroxiredoxin n=1 Tax=Caenorhabditis angaria TaxID=860376 RepID=A0A9P1IPD5_9PELO|nr:unnamed protein product [Caenorhabditis angaria]
MKLGDTVPNFKFSTNLGSYEQLYSTIPDGSWLMIFSHPADFTPVCTTELAELLKRADEFKARNVHIFAISIDSAEAHRNWAKDIWGYLKRNEQGAAGDAVESDLPFEIIADVDRSINVALGMIDPDEINCQGIALSARAVMLFGPDKKLKSKILYPATFGRNFDEILRMIDGVQLATTAPLATPVNWIPGQPVIAQPGLKTEEVIEKLCGGDNSNLKIVPLPSGKEYLRIVSGDNYKK